MSKLPCLFKEGPEDTVLEAASLRTEPAVARPRCSAVDFCAPACHPFATAFPLQFLAAALPSVCRDGFWHLSEAVALGRGCVEEQRGPVTQFWEWKRP